MDKKNSKYLLFPMTAAIIWGVLYIFTGIALKTLNSYEAAFFRNFIGAIALAVIMKIKGVSFHIKKEHRGYIWIIGFLGYFCCVIATTLSINYAGAVLSALLIAMTPVGIMVAAMFILKEPVKPLQWVMIAVALGGVAIISFGDMSGASWLGVLFAFVSITVWAFASSFIRKISAGYPPFVITFWSISASLVFYLPLMIVNCAVKGLPVFNFDTVIAIAFMALVGTATAQALWTQGLSKLPAAVCSMFYPLQPLTAGVVGVIFMDQELTWRLIAGGIIISVAIVGTLIFGREKTR